MKQILKVLPLEDSIQDTEMIQYLLLKEKLNRGFNLAKNKDLCLLALAKFNPVIILADHTLSQFNSK
jgi:hypothetical protein